MGRVENLNNYMIDSGRDNASRMTGSALRNIALVTGVIVAATVIAATLFAWATILLISSGLLG
jgi:hypothetical protein